MTAERHGKHRYYRWGSRQTYRRDLCPGRATNVDRAHAGLERICRQLRMSRPQAEQLQKEVTSLIAARVERETSRRSRTRDDQAALLASEMQLSQAFASGDLAPNAYQARTAQLRAKRAELATLAATAPASAQQLAESVGRTLQLATSFWDLYEHLSEIRKAALLKNFFETVVLDHEGIAGFTLKRPFTDLLKPRDARSRLRHTSHGDPGGGVTLSRWPPPWTSRIAFSMMTSRLALSRDRC